MSFKHKKKFGQNFLTDQNDVLNRIMEVSKVKEEEHIVEIGPGEGAYGSIIRESKKCDMH